MQTAVKWLTVVSLQTVVGVVFVFQRSYSTCRAGNKTNVLNITDGKASEDIFALLTDESKGFLVRKSFRSCKNSNLKPHTTSLSFFWLPMICLIWRATYI